MLQNVVTSDAQAARYREQGLWTAETLASRVAELGSGEHGHPDRGSGPAGQALAYLRRTRPRRRSAGGPARAPRVCGRETSCRSSCPTATRRSWRRSRVHSLGAVINPLLPNYRARELAHVFRPPRRGRSSPRRSTAASTTGRCRGGRGHDRVAPLASWWTTTATQPSAGISGGALRRGARIAAAVSELIFTSGTEATPQGDHAHRADDQLRVRVDLHRPRADRAGRGLDAVADRPLDRLQLRRARRALPRRCRWCCRTAGTPPTAVDLIAAERCTYTLAATTFLQDLVERVRAARACGSTSLQPLRLRRGAGAARAAGRRAPSRSASRAAPLRLDRGAGRDVEPARFSADEKRRDTDGRAMTARRGRRSATTTASPARPASPASSTSAARTPASASSPTRAHRGDVSDGRLGALGRPRPARSRDGYLTVVGRKKEIIIRGGMNIAPREIEELLVAFPEVERVGGGRAARRPARRARLRLRRAASRRARSTSPTMVDRLRATGLATYKLPERLEVLDALPTTASGKVQKHEICVRIQLAEAPHETRPRRVRRRGTDPLDAGRAWPRR